MESGSNGMLWIEGEIAALRKKYISELFMFAKVPCSRELYIDIYSAVRLWEDTDSDDDNDDDIVSEVRHNPHRNTGRYSRDPTFDDQALEEQGQDKHMEQDLEWKRGETDEEDEV